jgi:cysteine desulfurase
MTHEIKSDPSKVIYLDYQSAKPVDLRVVEAMIPYFSQNFGNPSSLHAVGDIATKALEKSRAAVARLINAHPDEIIFTGSATESINLALIGYAFRNMRKGNHIIISEVEHISILNLAKHLERNGFKVSRVPVDQYGRVDLEKLKKRITDQTILVSIQLANNEIGTIQPIQEIGEILKAKGIMFHTDAVAAEGAMPIDVNKLNVGLLSLSSNDIYGPKGVGALYKRKDVGILPQIIGGGQENGFRSGSENMPGIVGMAKAAELMIEELPAEIARYVPWREKIIKNVLDNVPRSHLNGHPTERLPNNVHFRFEAIEGESILLSFKDKGVAVSTGSACSSKTLEASHTLIATGLLHEEAHGSLELTWGRFTTETEIDGALAVLPGVVERLRKLSPLYKG